MTSHWIEILGWVFVGLGLASALVILVDELVLGYRQEMPIMDVVHPTTALYLGPVWLWAYFTRGRKSSRRVLSAEAHALELEGVDAGDLRRRADSTEDADLGAWHVANGVSHCGAGCTLGDVVGEWIVFAAGLTIAGATLFPELTLDFVLAWTFGVAFQYFTIVPMRSDVGRVRGLWLAVRADTFSILGFQIGLFGWMILSATVIWEPPLGVDTPTHWWMMQVGMTIGFLTSWPVNRWLIRRGWKEKMDHRRHLAERLAKHEERRPAVPARAADAERRGRPAPDRARA